MLYVQLLVVDKFGVFHFPPVIVVFNICLSIFLCALQNHQTAYRHVVDENPMGSDYKTEVVCKCANSQILLR